MSQTEKAQQNFDVVVVGAGFSGLYALYQLRKRGLKVRALELGTNVGGTWYWNRYPGARTDSTTSVYQYWFSDELLDEWQWSERFAAQEETERYLNHVADKFDLRRDIQFETRVTAADFDESSGRWVVKTEAGESFTAQFLLMGTGGLTEMSLPDFEGIDSFAGEWYHTARWPKEPVEFAGKRVGVFGTGATGIQVIQTIASQVEHLTVFQRTPTYTIPMKNPRLDEAQQAERRAQSADLKQRVHRTFSGAEFTFDEKSYFDFSAEERRARMEELWQDGSLSFWVGSFREVFTDERANAEVSEFVREKIRARLDDPAIAEKLVPTSYAFGTRRVPLETGYYEAYNRSNVELVDLRETPVKRITEKGVETSEREHELDMIIYATGFDAGTGALTHIDIRGKGGTVLRDAWADGIRSFMGLQVHGFPNMFMTMAPLSPAAAFCNVPTCIQQQIDWIADCIDFVRAESGSSIEPKAEAEAAWVAHHNEVASTLLVSKANSWYMGSNIAGKPRGLLAYAGGVDVYGDRCDEVKAGDYEEFDIARA
ncbi:MAG: flavin-containing monooxygenase [Gammaproteobacteria bacterium]